MVEKTIVGNWKMHLSPAEAGLLAGRLNQKIDHDPKVEIVLCPPFVDLLTVQKDMDSKKFKLGCQNIHYRDEGPFTGEISAAMVKGLADYAIVGHSERRAMGEDDKTIAEKLAAAVRSGIVPILCVGENLGDRHHGLTKKVVMDQLEANLAMLTAEDLHDFVIAYEPVWAIGTGDFAQPDDVIQVVLWIRHTIEELYGEEASSRVRILYGGSVDADNAKAYLNVDYVDGLLVGGASINYESFASIVKTAQEIANES